MVYHLPFFVFQTVFHAVFQTETPVEQDSASTVVNFGCGSDNSVGNTSNKPTQSCLLDLLKSPATIKGSSPPSHVTANFQVSSGWSECLLKLANF